MIKRQINAIDFSVLRVGFCKFASPLKILRKSLADRLILLGKMINRS